VFAVCGTLLPHSLAKGCVTDSSPKFSSSTPRGLLKDVRLFRGGVVAMVVGEWSHSDARRPTGHTDDPHREPR